MQEDIAAVTWVLDPRARARGRSCVLFAGFHKRTGQHAAVKRLAGGYGGARAEVEALLRLAHPSVNRLLDVHVTPAGVDLVLEWAEGTLERAGLPLPPDALARGWVRGLFQALAHVHERGFVHADVKPANLLVVRGRLVLGDFGSCRAARTPGPVSAPLYRAPELLLGEPLAAPSADVWAAGASAPRARH